MFISFDTISRATNSFWEQNRIRSSFVRFEKSWLQLYFQRPACTQLNGIQCLQRAQTASGLINAKYWENACSIYRSWSGWCFWEIRISLFPIFSSIDAPWKGPSKNEDFHASEKTPIFEYFNFIRHTNNSARPNLFIWCAANRKHLMRVHILPLPAISTTHHYIHTRSCAVIIARRSVPRHFSHSPLAHPSLASWHNYLMCALWFHLPHRQSAVLYENSR